MTDQIRDHIFAKCEAEGIEKVQSKLAQGLYGGKKLIYAKEWLSQQISITVRDWNKEDAEREQKVIGLMQDANNIAIHANDISRTANRRSLIAIGISVVSAIFAAIALYHSQT